MMLLLCRQRLIGRMTSIDDAYSAEYSEKAERFTKNRKCLQQGVKISHVHFTNRHKRLENLLQCVPKRMRKFVFCDSLEAILH